MILCCGWVVPDQALNPRPKALQQQRLSHPQRDGPDSSVVGLTGLPRPQASLAAAVLLLLLLLLMVLLCGVAAA